MNDTSISEAVTLVSGGTGLIGSHLLLSLLEKGDRVRAMKRTSSNTDAVRKIFRIYTDRSDDLFEKIEWVDVNLLDPLSLEQTFSGVHTVYHCAGMVSFDQKDKEIMMRVNAEGTANMVKGSQGSEVKKFCYLSSSSALGKPEAHSDEWITEKTEWRETNDLSDYARSKYMAEQEVWNGIAKGLPAVILNPVIVIGPGDWKRSSARLFQTVWNGLPFYGPGGNAFVDVRDVVRAMIQSTESGNTGERFTLVSENLSYQTFFHLVAGSLGKKGPRFKMPRWLGEIAWRADSLYSKLSGKAPSLPKTAIVSAFIEQRFSNEKIRHEMDFTFIPIAESIAHTGRIFLRDH